MLALTQEHNMINEQKFWIVTASADHAANGQSWGIVQACHGKSAPLRRMAAGDGVVIYSSKTTYRDGAPLMAFTAIGRIDASAPYQAEMEGGFVAWRRGVQWQTAAQPLPIRPLLQQLDLTRDQRSWGMVFRYGLVACSRADFALIARAMVPAEKAIPFAPNMPI